MRDDGIDVMGGLNSIGSLASGDLCENSMSGGGRKL